MLISSDPIEDCFATTWSCDGPPTLSADAQLSSPARPEPALVADRYQILRRLGAGGCGLVELAADLALQGRHVALKHLPPHTRDEPSARRRFANEARMTARVRHPNLVSVFDFDEDEKIGAYLVVEYVEGPSLADSGGARRSIPEVALIGAALADALGALHAASIVHRDVKPGNILLGARLDRMDVKLIDFGLACPTSGGWEEATETICGTPMYMAPEQIQAQAVDQRADVYAFACVVYELLTGTPVTGYVSRQAALTRQLLTTPSPLAAHGVEVPAWLERALFHALEKDPAARAASVDELGQALRALVDEGASRGR